MRTILQPIFRITFLILGGVLSIPFAIVKTAHILSSMLVQDIFEIRKVFITEEQMQEFENKQNQEGEKK